MPAAEPAVQKLYSLDEANQRLPLVRVIVQDIVLLYRDITERRERLAEVRRVRGDSASSRMYAEELEQVEIDIQRDEDRFIAFVEELSDLGAQLKDPSRGLIDFYSRLDDRVVDLCWMLGEGDIQHWHELDAGFPGRQSVCGEHFKGDFADEFGVPLSR